MGAAGTWWLVGAGLDEPSIPQCLGNSARACRTNAVMQHTPLAHRASLCPHLQALAALLVCEAADDCHGALRVVEQWVPAGDRCLLHLDARHLGTDKGALQVRSAVHCWMVVAHLTGCTCLCCTGAGLPAALGCRAPGGGQHEQHAAGPAASEVQPSSCSALDQSTRPVLALFCVRPMGRRACSPFLSPATRCLRHPCHLQEQLASFLSTMPSGLVVLRRIDQVCLRYLGFNPDSLASRSAPALPAC